MTEFSNNKTELSAFGKIIVAALLFSGVGILLGLFLHMIGFGFGNWLAKASGIVLFAALIGFRVFTQANFSKSSLSMFENNSWGEK